MSINDMQYFSIEDRRAIFENNIINYVNTIYFVYFIINIITYVFIILICKNNDDILYNNL